MSGVRDCRYILKKVKFEYVGHVARCDKNSWKKKVLEWCPKDRKRKTGRPKSRCEDEGVKIAGRVWTGNARVCECWRRIGEAYAWGKYVKF